MPWMRRAGPLIALVAIALVARLAVFVADTHPYKYSGLAAGSAEMARQIDQHGRWFESNITALTYLQDVQVQRRRLVDPAALSFAAADAHPQMQPQVLEPPGEAVVLAGIWKLTGEYWWPYQVLMIILSALVAPLVFYISLRLFKHPRAAYIAGALYGVYPALTSLTSIPHLDVWSVDLTIVVVAMLVRALADRRDRWLLATGAVLGLGCYFRPELLLLAPAIAVATFRRREWRDAARLALVPTIVGLLFLVPWTVRNIEVFHQFIPVRIGTGQNLWEGLGELPNGYGAVLSDTVTANQVHRARPRLVYGSPAYDAYLQTKALDVIEAHPGFEARLIIHRLFEATFGFAGLFLISLAVAIATRRRFGYGHRVLAAVIVATTAPYLLLHLESRYELPAVFAYLIWTGLGVELLAARLASVRARRVAAQA